MTPWATDGWSGSLPGAVSTLVAPSIANSRTASSLNPVFNVANGGGSVSNNHKLYGGSAYPGSSITVYRDGVSQGAVTADGSGNWIFPLGVLADATYSLTATVTSGAQTSAQSSAFFLSINPSFTDALNTNKPYPSADYPYCGQLWSVHNDPSNPNAIKAPNTHQIDLVCLPTDSWPAAPSNRSESQNLNQFGDGTIFNWTWEFLLNGSDPVNNASGLVVIGQIHDSSGPPVFCFFLQEFTDKLAVALKTPSQDYPYAATVNMTRGVWHTMDVQVRPAPSGAYARVWVDGTQVVNATACYAVAPYYCEFGYYRNPPTGNDQTGRVSYRNMVLVYT